MGRKTVRNVITSPALIAQIHPDNAELLNDFLEYMRSIQRSETTILGYENDIQIAFVWNLQHNGNRPFVEWTKRMVVKYQNYLLEDNQNSPARVKRLKAALSSLANYVENILDDEYPDFRNIIKKVESPVNQPVREKTVLSDEQIKALLDMLVEKKSYAKACMLALAVYSGRRKAELTRFTVADFDERHLVCNGALYRSDPIKTKGRGTTGKMLECFTLAKQFKPYLDLWLAQRKQTGIESKWLFPDRSDPNKHIGISCMNSWANSFSKLMGVDFYWHCTRHMTVTSFKRAGIPDTVIQQYIGWSDISMVPVYVDMKADEQLSMYFDGSSEDGIVIPEAKSLSEL